MCRNPFTKSRKENQNPLSHTENGNSTIKFKRADNPTATNVISRDSKEVAEMGSFET